MTNEELQNIIREATDARLAGLVARREAISDVSVRIEHPQTPEEAAARPETHNLEDSAIDSLIAEMTGVTAQPQQEAEAEETDADQVPETSNEALERVISVSSSNADSDITARNPEAPSYEVEVAQAEEPEEQPEDATIPSGIPDEPESVEHAETTSRFRGAAWFEEANRKNITIAGLGGIGSWTALLLARIHPASITLWDPDTVEAGNLSGQLYGYAEVRRTKVSAIASIMKCFADYYSYFTHDERFEEGFRGSDIMISGFDNMAARRAYYGAWRAWVNRYTEEEDKERCLYIDARMSAESIQILCMTGVDYSYMREYEEKWLFSDEEADSEVCSYKQTSFCAAIIGGLITNLFVNFCTNLTESAIIPRQLPFMTSYDAETLLLNVKN